MTNEIDLDVLGSGDIRFAAMAVAAVVHNGQTYFGDQAFVEHPLDVAGVAAEFGYNTDAMTAAALLHDAVEDTDLTIEEVEEMFGPVVAGLVDAVTDITGPNGEPLPREERRRLTRAKTKLNRQGVCLKLCDRIANTRAGVDQLETDRKTAVYYLEKYAEEYPEFRADLYVEGEWDNLWQELDNLYEFLQDELDTAA